MLAQRKGFVVLESGLKLKMQIELLSIKVKLTLTGCGAGTPWLKTSVPFVIESYTKGLGENPGTFFGERIGNISAYIWVERQIFIAISCSSFSSQ